MNIDELQGSLVCSEKLQEIGKALTIFQSKCPAIEKNTEGYGYRYADLAIIINTIKPYLLEAGLSFSQQLYNKDKNVGVQTILIHGESGEFISSNVDANLNDNIQKNMSPVQGMGSIITYLRRYSLSAILGLVTDDDIDGFVSKNQKKNTTKKDTEITWLSEEQFKKTMESSAKSINAVLKAYSTSTKKMKKDYEVELKKQLAKITKDEKQ